MYNNFYGLMKDGSFSVFDSSMTISNKYKWDYNLLDDDKIRIFNPENNDTICFFYVSDLDKHFDYEFEDAKNNWDLVVEYVLCNVCNVIVNHYKKTK